jgi:hypothetical protein
MDYNSDSVNRYRSKCRKHSYTYKDMSFFKINKSHADCIAPHKMTCEWFVLVV